MTGLAGLLARVREAKTANYALDDEIADALNGERPAVPPNYSASIDAALALVERVMPGTYWLIAKGKTRPDEPMFACQIRKAEPDLVPLSEFAPLGEAEHDHVCLAILAALLSALIAREST